MLDRAPIVVCTTVCYHRHLYILGRNTEGDCNSHMSLELMYSQKRLAEARLRSDHPIVPSQRYLNHPAVV
jgi:hypothetical protein